MMATCRECLHYEMCYILDENPWERDVDGVENDCSGFKDKTKYVEQKHGHWEFLGGKHAVCTNCGMVIETHLSQLAFLLNYKHCIYCGAKMDDDYSSPSASSNSI